MNKILAVAKAEYFIAATSKAFMLGVIMMPIFMGGALGVQYLTSDQIDISARKVAIVDESNQLYDAIEKHADDRNQNKIFTKEESGERTQTQAEFVVEKVLPGSDGEKRLDVVLTERVKSGDLFAFVIIEKEIFDTTKDAGIRYHSQTPSYGTLPDWIQRTVNMEIKLKRTNELGLSKQNVDSLSKEVPLRNFGLVTTDADGAVTDAKEESRVLTMLIPVAGVMLMFMMVMTVAPAMLNNVLEEKMQKISEFLISSITPFQLMMGKLVGAIGIGLTLSVIYLGAAYSMAVYFEVSDRVPVTLYLWFVFFLFIALVIFGSIFSAVGAACTEIKDAQSLMTPIMMLLIIPMMCFGPVLDSPTSSFSRAVSLFPPATPMLMFVRIAIPPGPEIWEIILAVLFSSIFAVGCVWAAGKVFRVGILSQGQAPSLAKLVRWIFTK